MYGGMTSEFKLRKLMVDNTVERGSEAWLEPEAEANDIEFLLDLTKAMFRSRSGAMFVFIRHDYDGRCVEDEDGGVVKVEEGIA